MEDCISKYIHSTFLPIPTTIHQQFSTHTLCLVLWLWPKLIFMFLNRAAKIWPRHTIMHQTTPLGLAISQLGCPFWSQKRKDSYSNSTWLCVSMHLDYGIHLNIILFLRSQRPLWPCNYQIIMLLIPFILSGFMSLLKALNFKSSSFLHSQSHQLALSSSF